MQALGINLGYLLVHILNFLLLFLVLRAWVFKPLLGKIDEHREAVRKAEEDARVAAEAREEAEAEADKMVNEAQRKAAMIIREANERADAAAQDSLESAEEKIALERDQAMHDVDMERSRIMGEVRDQVVQLAIAGAEKVLVDTIDESRQRTLLDDFFKNLKLGEFKMPEDFTVTGDIVEIASAIPLTEEEKQIVRNAIQERVGDNEDFKYIFRLKPELLGGILIRAGDKVMDDSIRGKLDALEKQLE
jgi:F-type H+-transporting ATPase subunit b